jgi:predicted DNA binding CopG/RHH family protein
MRPPQAEGLPHASVIEGQAFAVNHGRRGAVPTRNISIRLPITDLERARNLAEQRGVGYQTVIKSLLHEALKKEFKSASKQSRD